MIRYTDFITKVDLHDKYYFNNKTSNNDDYSLEPTEKPDYIITYYPTIIKTNCPSSSNMPTISSNMPIISSNDKQKLNNFTEKNLITTIVLIAFAFFIAIFVYKSYYLQKIKNKRYNDEKNIEGFGMNADDIIDL